MTWLVDGLSGLALLCGAFFVIVGGAGLLRMPDFYTRMHAAGVTDTLGAGLILLGLMLQAGWTLITAKLLLILIFLWLTSPTASHALVRAALSDPQNPPPLLQEDIQSVPSPSSTHLSEGERIEQAK
ncbi:MAG TPA: monovalent cation/H(+) antiporter subunit G [Candidatus Competibacteraceae bacterium]|nr:monovalent cation/H(+) antiporter subunit G [Candidatus Competibacteraceae bacterium]MCP5133254.1 monovalent cation/H(+) antiporter subunit G [Gammaproteobacteria bacterium]HPF57333.1 monovalent cation/H(+) antiporter subunit G [Candidatus Competibacteraceae bacterium]HRY17846.1 monovalent cation/H(+) antiporter subunit G [Candidatus Competibacteraceae bacterium]